MPGPSLAQGPSVPVATPGSTISNPVGWQPDNPSALPVCAGIVLLFLVMVGAGLYWSWQLDAEPKNDAESPVPVIARDLDAAEAATLLHAPPGRILTLVMFGLMKKGNIRLYSVDPVRLEVVSRNDLTYYEKTFVDAICQDALDDAKLPACFRELSQHVTGKVRHASLRYTEDFYRNKIEEAWADLDGTETPELKVQKYDDHMLWLMADGDFGRKLDEKSLAALLGVVDQREARMEYLMSSLMARSVEGISSRIIRDPEEYLIHLSEFAAGKKRHL